MNSETKIQLGFTAHGHPRVYDFLWEYAGNACKEMGEKTIELRVGIKKIVSPKRRGYQLKPRGIGHLVEKFLMDKRWARKPKLVITKKGKELVAQIPAKSLENVVNAHNILFHLYFPNIELRGKKSSIRFSSPKESTIIVSAPQTRLRRMKRFISRKGLTKDEKKNQKTKNLIKKFAAKKKVRVKK